MVRLVTEKVGQNITRIYGINGEQMYLIEGTRKAALIDTASGVGDLKRFIEELTDTCLGLTTYEKNLQAVNKRTKGLYDQALMSHGKMKATDSLMEEVLDCIRQVKEKTDDQIEFKFRGTVGRVAKEFGDNGICAYARKDGKVGNLVYNPERIWE